mgnify:CR=1 FL=1
MKITVEALLKKLGQLDQRLLNIWVSEDADLSDDERWEIFAVLLESRVELLAVLRDAGHRLTPEICLPPWLDRLTSRKREVRLRELKTTLEEKRSRDRISAYREVASAPGESENT